MPLLGGKRRRRRAPGQRATPKPAPNNVLEIERRMQMLRWRKAQNEAKIRSKLLQTKQMREQDQLAQLVTNKAQLKAEWIQRIVEDEISKPLQVTDEFIDDMIKVRATYLASASSFCESVLSNLRSA